MSLTRTGTENTPHTPEPTPLSRIGHSTPLVGVPAAVIASLAYNDAPVPLVIPAVRETNRALYSKLAECPDARSAGQIFQDYMDVVFGLARPDEPACGACRRFRASYLRLLKGWAFDASNPEGAVLKGWVESRFGLFPTWHKAALTRFSSPQWIAYVEEKMAPRFHNNAVHAQLDLLYSFCQWRLEHFPLLPPPARHLRLYRGVNDLTEHPLVQRIDKRTAQLRLNNLSSFSANRDRAGEFGDCILEAEVPLTKILFFNDLLPKHMLKGEGEYLVIGGDYRVRTSWL